METTGCSVSSVNVSNVNVSGIEGNSGQPEMVALVVITAFEFVFEFKAGDVENTFETGGSHSAGDISK
jgi:hypothetical protein